LPYHLNSSLAQSAGKLWWCKVTVKKWFTLVLTVNPPSTKGINVAKLLNTVS